MSSHRSGEPTGTCGRVVAAGIILIGVLLASAGGVRAQVKPGPVEAGALESPGLMADRTRPPGSSGLFTTLSTFADLLSDTQGFDLVGVDELSLRSLAVMSTYQRRHSRGFFAVRHGLFIETDKLSNVSWVDFTNHAVKLDYRGERTTLTLAEDYVPAGSPGDLSPEGIESERSTVWKLELDTRFRRVHSPRLSFGIGYNLARGDRPEEFDEVGLRPDEGAPFLRSTVRPQLDYALSEQTAMSLGYTGRILLNEDERLRDTHTQDLWFGLDHRLSETTAARGSYRLKSSNDQDAEGSLTHFASAGLVHAWRPRTRLGAAGSASLKRRSRPGLDSVVYKATGDVQHQLTENLSTVALGGVGSLQRESGFTRRYPIWSLSLSGRFPSRGTDPPTLLLTADQDIEDTTGSIDSVGVVLRRRTRLRFACGVGRNASLSLFGAYARTKLLEVDRTLPSAEYRLAGAHFVWAPWRHLSFTARYRYRRRVNLVAESEPRIYHRLTLVISTGGWLF